MREASVFRDLSRSSLSLTFFLALMTVADSKNFLRRMADFNT